MNELPRGTRVGGYVVDEPLGRGATAAVYRAHDAAGRAVALKVLARTSFTDSSAERFAREARTATRVRHPNVVAVLDSGEERGHPFLVLELVARGDLEERLVRAGRLPWPEVARLGAGIARGLVAVHAAGLVHRDVKPSNVLVDAAGEPRLGDFGLVRRAGLESVALTEAGDLVGTLEYCSPEQADGREVDARADLYGLGATLYALLAGQPPFAGRTGMALVRAHLVETPRPLWEVAPGVPAALERLVERLLAKDPGARGTAAEAASTLASLASEEAPVPRRLALVAVPVAALALLAVLAARPVVAPPPTTTPPTTPPAPPPKIEPARERAPPAWHAARCRSGRAPATLPPGVAFGRAEGEYVNEKDGSVLVYVPAGKVTVGHAAMAVEVELAAFFIGKYETTVEQFGRFVAETGHVGDAQRWRAGHAIRLEPALEIAVLRDGSATWQTPGGSVRGSPARGDEPVAQVSVRDARAYCRWAGLRLPTVEEWETAAGWDPVARRRWSFPWGDEAEPGTANLRVKDTSSFVRPGVRLEDYEDGFPRVAPVGSFPRGVSRFGVHDALGNVTELCEESPRADTPEGDGLPSMGAHFAESFKEVWRRATPIRSFCAENLGFRVARPADR